MLTKNILVFLLLIVLAGCDKISSLRRQVRGMIFGGNSSQIDALVSDGGGSQISPSSQGLGESEEDLPTIDEKRVDQFTEVSTNDSWGKGLQLCQSYLEDASDTSVKNQLISALEENFKAGKKISSTYQEQLENCLIGLSEIAQHSFEDSLKVLKVFAKNLDGENKNFLLKIISGIWTQNPKHFFEEFSPIFEHKQCSWIVLSSNANNVDEELNVEMWQQKLDTINQLEKELYSKVLIHSFLMECSKLLKMQLSLAKSNQQESQVEDEARVE